MTPALKLFEHLADFSEEQPPAAEAPEEGFVPLIAPGLQEAEPGIGNLDPFAEGDVDLGVDDPFAPAPASGIPDLESGALDFDPAVPDALPPVSADDPFGPDSAMLAPEAGLAELDGDRFGADTQLLEPETGLAELGGDPFGPDGGTLAMEPDPFADQADPFESDAMLPDAVLPDIESDPFGPEAGLEAAADGVDLPQPELDSFPDNAGLVADEPLSLDEIPGEAPVDGIGDPPGTTSLTASSDPFSDELPQTEPVPEALVPVGSDEIPPDLESIDNPSVDQVETVQPLEEAENQTVQHFAVALAEAEDKLTELVCSSVAGILANILNDELVRKSVEALAGRVREVTGPGGALRIDVRGPGSLYEKLKDALGENAPELCHTEDNSPDLVIEIDSQIVSSRIGEWRQSVEECFA